MHGGTDEPEPEPEPEPETAPEPELEPEPWPEPEDPPGAPAVPEGAEEFGAPAEAGQAAREAASEAPAPGLGAPGTSSIGGALGRAHPPPFWVSPTASWRLQRPRQGRHSCAPLPPAAAARAGFVVGGGPRVAPKALPRNVPGAFWRACSFRPSRRQDGARAPDDSPISTKPNSLISVFVSPERFCVCFYWLAYVSIVFLLTTFCVRAYVIFLFYQKD